MKQNLNEFKTMKRGEIKEINKQGEIWFLLYVGNGVYQRYDSKRDAGNRFFAFPGFSSFRELIEWYNKPLTHSWLEE